MVVNGRQRGWGTRQTEREEMISTSNKQCNVRAVLTRLMVVATRVRRERGWGANDEGRTARRGGEWWGMAGREGGGRGGLNEKI